MWCSFVSKAFWEKDSFELIHVCFILIKVDAEDANHSSEGSLKIIKVGDIFLHILVLCHDSDLYIKKPSFYATKI